MAYGWWDNYVPDANGPKLTPSRNGQVVTLALEGMARYGDSGSRSWEFKLYKGDSYTGINFTGWADSGGSYSTATFTGQTVTYTLSSSDIGSTVTFKVLGFCNGNRFLAEAEEYKTPTCSVSVPSVSILWSSGADITVSQTSDMKALVTRVGSAYVDTPYSGTVYYRLWCGGTRKNQDDDTGSSWDVTPNAYDVELTYTLQAYATIWGREFTPSAPLTETFTVVSGNYIDYFDGTNWVQCKAYYYDGSSWVECKPYYYDGTSWVECSS